MKNLKSILSYRSHLQFLNDYYYNRKADDPAFSYTRWSRELGFKNRGYLRIILTGSRPINENYANLLIQFFNFSKDERDYFLLLLNYHQSKTVQQKKFFSSKLYSYHFRSEEFADIEQQYDFLGNGLLPRLLTLLSFNDFPQDPSLAALLLKTSTKEFEEACRRLEEWGLVTKDPESMRWTAVKKSWHVNDNFLGLGHREFYVEALSKAKNAIDLYSPAERRFRSLLVAMGPEDFADFMRDFEVFANEQMLKRDVSSVHNRRLYHLQFSFFPETQMIQAPDLESK